MPFPLIPPGKLQILIMSGGMPTHTAAAENVSLTELDLAYPNYGVRVIANLSRKQIAYCSRTILELTGYTSDFILATELTKLFQIIHPKDRFDYQLHLHHFCKNTEQLPNRPNIGKRFRANHKSGKCIELWQVTEVFKYEEDDMLLIHLKKYSPQRNSVLTAKACVSDRELEVLRLLGLGFSSKEIADKLCISGHTAVSHRKNLIEKFQVRNTAHLIREASKLLEL